MLIDEHTLYPLICKSVESGTYLDIFKGEKSVDVDGTLDLAKLSQLLNDFMINNAPTRYTFGCPKCGNCYQSINQETAFAAASHCNHSPEDLRNLD